MLKLLTIIMLTFGTSSANAQSTSHTNGETERTLAKWDITQKNGEGAALILEESRIRRSAPKRGFKYVFRVRLARDVASGDAKRGEIAIEIPDIRTHDRVGAPEPIRTGTLYWSDQSQFLYVVTVKSIGRIAIFRVHEFVGNEVLDVRRNTPAQARQVTHLEVHNDSVAESITVVNVIHDEQGTHIIGRVSRDDAPATTLLLRTGKLRLSKDRE